MMHKRGVIGLVILLLATWVFYSGSLITAAPLPQSSTPTPVPEEEAAEGTHSEATEMAELAEQVERLQDQYAQLEALVDSLLYPSVEQINQVNTAIYLLDNAGLHAIDERLNEEGIIEAGDGGHVDQIARLLSTVDWPEELGEEAEALHGALLDLSEALADDNLEDAATWAMVAHEEQHNFSHTAVEWLEDVEIHEANDESAQTNRVNTAIYLLDNVDLHVLDVRLNEEGAIEPGDSSRVGRIARLLSTVDWPESLSEDAEALLDTLLDLSDALADDDLERAAPLATQVHEEQHEFSHAAVHWLEEMMNAKDPAATAEEHGQEEDHEHADQAGSQ